MPASPALLKHWGAFQRAVLGLAAEAVQPGGWIAGIQEQQRRRICLPRRPAAGPTSNGYITCSYRAWKTVKTDVCHFCAQS
jgi:hypothetical protein